jgi:hypothetical protein
MLKEILLKVDEITNFVGNHSYLGFTGTAVPLVGSLAYQVVIQPQGPHPLQIVSWCVAGLVGVGTILALIKTHTTAFDKIKWIKKNKQ